MADEVDVKKIVGEISNSIRSEIRAELNSQIEKLINERTGPLIGQVNNLENDVKQIAEAGRELSGKVITLIDNVNEIGKKVSGITRESKAQAEKAQSIFSTLLDEEET